MKKRISHRNIQFFFAITLNFLLFSCDKKEVNPEVSISSFNPTTGLTGASVVITGANFSTKATDNVVKFGGKDAIVTSASTTQILATVPENATSGKISVTFNGVTAISADDFVVLQQPTITSLNPVEGTVGTTVTITGTNFSTVAANDVVKFNGAAATVTAASSTEITVTVPAGATTGRISISISGVTVTSASDFVVKPPPTLTTFTPASGTVGTKVTITGTNFNTVAAENVVKFNGTVAAVTAASATQLTVAAPSGLTTGPISVTTFGITVTSENDFLVLPPVITSFAPSSGPVGTTVTITGTNFSALPGENVVMINGVAATVTAATVTELSVIVPTTTTGRITISIGSNTATSTTDFTVYLPPTITAFDPAYYNTNDALPIVTITGTEFSGIASENIVQFNGVSATVTTATTTQLTMTLPAAATSGSITVTVHGFTVTSSNMFLIGCPDAHPVNLTVSNIVENGALFSMDAEFDIQNVGSIPLDLSKMNVQTFVSTTATVGGMSQPAGGGPVPIDGSSLLMPGNSVHITYSGINGNSTLSSYLYTIIRLGSSLGAPIECNENNNEVSVNIP